jgi:3-hydroxybutyryl-CoA dehydrogenase
MGQVRLAVIGAGTMGHGIAQVAAIAGYDTRLTDAGASLGVGAIFEPLDAKQELFRRLDLAASADSVLATNTSALSVSRIADATRHPERVVGMHFFNPVHIMKLVEIVTHARAGRHAIERARETTVRMGKEPILVRDTPGFASSRLGVVLGLEAMRMVEQGVANAEDIDKALELGYGHPMGPLKVSDLVGLDVRLAIAEHLFHELKQPHYKPPAILKNKVQAGELGKKTGKGFYQWPSTPS